MQQPEKPAPCCALLIRALFSSALVLIVSFSTWIVTVRTQLAAILVRWQKKYDQISGLLSSRAGLYSHNAF